MIHLRHYRDMMEDTLQNYEEKLEMREVQKKPRDPVGFKTQTSRVIGHHSNRSATPDAHSYRVYYQGRATRSLKGHGNCLYICNYGAVQ